MAAKKKTKKKKITAKKTAGKKTVSLKKKAKPAPKKTAKSKAKKTVSAKTAKKSKKKVSSKKKNFETLEFPTSRTVQQSGDFQGLSRSEDADSESVEELLEEGNTFEAGVVSGVEEADDADESEVHTHEVPEDDVPEEYLDRDE